MIEKENNTNQRISFHVIGMTCINCARMVEKTLRKDPRVSFVSINLATETGFVEAKDEISLEDIRSLAQSVGYDVSADQKPKKSSAQYHQVRRRMWIAVMITVPLGVMMIMHMAGVHIMAFVWVETILAGYVVFGLGLKTVRGAWIALAHRHTNMDTLIFLGSATAWLTGVVHLSGFPIASFASIGAMIMTLHLLGRFIESHLRDRATREIRALVDRQPKEARMVEGQERKIVPVEAVGIDAIVEVYAGEKIPLDGMIVSGFSGVDESMITGESLPVTRSEGDPVIAGSIVLNRPIQVKVTKVGADTFIAQMIDLIQQAQGTKVPIQALADRITAWFVPIVLVLAVGSGLFWFFAYAHMQPFVDQLRSLIPWIPHHLDNLSFSLFTLISTLVIACPCALGLATPMALIRGTTAAASHGLLIRNGEAIQTSQKIAYVLFDKTGTLTQNDPKVVESTVPESWFSVIHRLESRSNHPLAKALVAYTAWSGEQDGFALDEEQFEFEEIAGQGIRAKDAQRSYEIGKPDADRSDDSRTSVQFRIDDQLIGYFWIEDPIRQDAKPTVKKLVEMGIEPVIVSGDREQVVSRVAKELGLSTFFSGVLPSQKLDVVRQYQSSGKKVMMVGDGLNDAAALKGADVGVAMGSGTDLAMESADIVILAEGISRILKTLSISRKTFSTIRQNLFWAFLYNILAIPAAMIGLLHPAIAELAMAISSISVILNSMRIKR